MARFAFACVFWLTLTCVALANGNTPQPSSSSERCFEQNRLTLESLSDEMIPQPTNPGGVSELFEQVVLPDDLRPHAFVLLSKQDGRFIVIPNQLRLIGLSWKRREEQNSRGRYLCGSRLILLFERLVESEGFQRALNFIRQQNPNAAVHGPWMERTRSVLPLPFLGRQEIFSIGPGFPVGWPLIVWNIDAPNTQRLQNYARDLGRQPQAPPAQRPAGSPLNGGIVVDGRPALVGVIQFRDRHTGGVFDINVSVTAEALLNQLSN